MDGKESEPAGIAPDREIELKLEVPQEALARLRVHPLVRCLTRGRAATRAVRSVYFDSRQLALARRGLSLRVRRVKGAWVQTVKTRGGATAGLFDRAEVECPVAAEAPDIARIPDPHLRRLLEDALGDEPLEPVIETEVSRTRRLLGIGTSELVFDLDAGEVRTRSGTIPIRELELELVRGAPDVLYDLALELHETIPLRPSTLDKATRGYALLTGEQPGARKARRISLGEEALLEDLLVAAVADCLEQIVGNEPAARAGLDPEGVHQLRVGVRRLRAVLGLYSGVLPGEQAGRFREELHWLAGELGDARDLDVFLDEILEPLFQSRSADPALKRLREEARELRDEGYARARRALLSPRFGGLVLELGRWLVARGWREQRPSGEAAPLFASAREQTRPLLDSRHRKVMKLGRRLGELGPKERHRLRIRVKKLRYAAELLGSVHGAGAKRYTRRLARLQDALGELNDAAVTDRLLSRLLARVGSEATSRHQRAAGLVAGRSARRAERGLEKLPKRWRAFAKLGTFWTRS